MSKMALESSRKEIEKDAEGEDELSSKLSELKIDKDELSIILDLPIQVSELVIDLMKPIDRARFARCSRVANEAAKKSRNYIYGISFHDYLTTSVINVFCQPGSTESYSYNFEEIEKEKFKICRKSSGQELWREKLADDVDLNAFCCQFFRHLLSLYQRKIRALTLDISRNRDFDFGFERFDRLRNLTLDGDFDIGPVVTKIRKPLEDLSIRVSNNNSIDLNQVYETRDNLRIRAHSINNEQFLKIRAKVLHMESGSLSEENIAAFIRSYQNDTINRNAAHYFWSIDDSTFDCHKLWKILGKTLTNTSNESLLIRHSTKKKGAFLKLRNDVYLSWVNIMG